MNYQDLSLTAQILTIAASCYISFGFMFFLGAIGDPIRVKWVVLFLWPLILLNKRVEVWYHNFRHQALLDRSDREDRKR